MMKVALLLLSCADAVVSYVVANNGPRLAIRPNSPRLTTMRAPYDSRSVTETFEMWSAALPPAGFVWGFDTRSTTENYEQWVASQSSSEPSSPPPPPPPTTAKAVGVPSVGETVLSWYDSGSRLSSDEAPAETGGAPADSEASYLTWTDDSITLSEEQVKAYGGPAVRPLNDRDAEEEEEEEENAVPFLEAVSEDGTSITLTELQLKAYGGPAVRPLNDRDEETAVPARVDYPTAPTPPTGFVWIAAEEAPDDVTIRAVCFNDGIRLVAVPDTSVAPALL